MSETPDDINRLVDALWREALKTARGTSYDARGRSVDLAPAVALAATLKAFVARIPQAGITQEQAVVALNYALPGFVAHILLVPNEPAGWPDALVNLSGSAVRHAHTQRQMTSAEDTLETP